MDNLHAGPDAVMALYRSAINVNPNDGQVGRINDHRLVVGREIIGVLGTCQEPQGPYHYDEK